MPKWPFHSDQLTQARGVVSISSGLLVVIAVITLFVGGLTWHTLGELRQAVRQQRVDALTQSVELVASQTELALQDHDFSRIRRLLIDAQATGHYQRLSIEYGDQQLLLSTDLGSEYRQNLPANWGESSLPVERKSRFDPAIHRLTIHEPLQVSEHQNAVLIAESMPFPRLEMLWRFQLASKIMVLSGLVMGLLAILQLRQRTAPLFAIRSALCSYAQGHTSTHSLLVSSQFGPEARAFNDLLQERDALVSRLDLMDCENTISSIGSDTFGLSSICAALSHGMIVLDTNLNIIYLNSSGAAYLGADPSMSIGKSLESIDTEESFMKAASSILNPDAARKQVFEIELEHSSSILRATCSRVSRDQDTICLIYLEDITQQRHADKSLNVFIAQATHELRTPLTNIRLYTEEAMDSEVTDEKFRSEAFNMISSESRRLERLVSDMLCVSELEAGSMQIRKESVRPESMFEELERDYSAQAQAKEIVLNFDMPPKFPTIEGDRDRLGQAIHNLIGNALKYTPTKGTVTVKVDFDEMDSMTVSVSDTGIGISKEDQKRIFERFCRASDQRIESIAGTGLGLTITQEIAKMHAGDLVVESELDQGSTFILTIPSGRSAQNNAVNKAA